MVVHICIYVLIRAHIVRLRDLAAKIMYIWANITIYIQYIYEYNKAFEGIYQSVFAYICLYIQSYIHIQAYTAKIHTYTGDHTCCRKSCGDAVIHTYTGIYNVFIYACIGNSQKSTVHVSVCICLYLSVYVCIWLNLLLDGLYLYHTLEYGSDQLIYCFNTRQPGSPWAKSWPTSWRSTACCLSPTPLSYRMSPGDSRHLRDRTCCGESCRNPLLGSGAGCRGCETAEQHRQQDSERACTAAWFRFVRCLDTNSCPPWDSNRTGFRSGRTDTPWQALRPCEHESWRSGWPAHTSTHQWMGKHIYIKHHIYRYWLYTDIYMQIQTHSLDKTSKYNINMYKRTHIQTYTYTYAHSYIAISLFINQQYMHIRAYT